MRVAVMGQQDRIAVLGATGYTGRLIAQDLHRHGVDPLLAGRSSEKLARLARSLGGAETLRVDVAEPASIEALARRSKVLINCVGPFVDLGEPVVRAVIAAGAHYLDTTGEQPFVRAMRAHHAEAKKRKSTVIPAMAFEVAVGDSAAALAARGLGEIDSIRITYATRFHASQGTQRTALRMLQSVSLVYENGAWVERAPGRERINVDLPEPFGRVAAVSFPSAEVVTVPQHVKTRTVKVYLSMPVPIAALLPALSPALGALARSPLGRLAGAFIGEAGEGPDRKTRKGDRFLVAADAAGRRGGKAVRQRVLVRGRDPYGLTAAVARLGALWLASEDAPRGVLAPAAAFDARRVLDALAGEGVAYEEIGRA